jgi:hypothetical protein
MLQRIAGAEGRSVSSLIRGIIAEWEERRELARVLVDSSGQYDAGAGHS